MSMKKLFLFSVYVLLASFLPAPLLASSSPAIAVEDIRVEPISFAGTDFAWFLVRCTVENPTEQAGVVSVVIRTIDDWAYDRKPLRLSGRVTAGGKAHFSVLDCMDYKMFKKLRRYEIKSVELH